MTINGGHRGTLIKQDFEPRAHQYWDEGFALLQGIGVDNGTIVPLGRNLWLHNQSHRLKASYALFLWPYPYGNHIREALSLCPGYPRASYLLEFNSGHDVINILDKGHNVIWSNTSIKVQAWLRLLSEPAKIPTWKQYTGKGIWRYLTWLVIWTLSCPIGALWKVFECSPGCRKTSLWVLTSHLAITASNIGFSKGCLVKGKQAPLSKVQLEGLHDITCYRARLPYLYMAYGITVSP